MPHHVFVLFFGHRLRHIFVHLVGTGFLELFHKISSGHVGAVLGISPALVFLGTEFLDNLFVMF